MTKGAKTTYLRMDPDAPRTYSTAPDEWTGSCAVTAPMEARVGALVEMACVWRTCGEFVKAETAAWSAYVIGIGGAGSICPPFDRAIYELAWLRLVRGDTDEAETMFRRFVGIRSRNPPISDGNAARCCVVLADLLFLRGDVFEAEEFAVRGLSGFLCDRGALDPETHVAMAMLARTRRAMGDLSRAVALATEVVACRKLAWGEDHPLLAVSTCDLAEILVEAGSPEQAEALYQEAVLALEATKDVQWSADLARANRGLARLHASHGDGRAAAAAVLRAAAFRPIN